MVARFQLFNPTVIKRQSVSAFIGLIPLAIFDASPTQFKGKSSRLVGELTVTFAWYTDYYFVQIVVTLPFTS